MTKGQKIVVVALSLWMAGSFVYDCRHVTWTQPTMKVPDTSNPNPYLAELETKEVPDYSKPAVKNVYYSFVPIKILYGGSLLLIYWIPAILIGAALFFVLK